jgi:hypothetical protein
MKKNIGDFVLIKESKKPGIIISTKVEDSLLISIHEYNGDYIFVDYNNAEYIDIEPEEKLSILANFGEWFYDEHKELYQEILIENINNNLKFLE